MKLKLLCALFFAVICFPLGPAIAQGQLSKEGLRALGDTDIVGFMENGLVNETASRAPGGICFMRAKVIEERLKICSLIFYSPDSRMEEQDIASCPDYGQLPPKALLEDQKLLRLANQRMFRIMLEAAANSCIPKIAPTPQA